MTGLNHLRALTLYSGMSVLLAIDDHIADEVVTEQYQDPDVRAMLRLRDGDDSAIEELVERDQTERVGYLYHHCWDQRTAADLAQTVFIKPTGPASAIGSAPNYAPISTASPTMPGSTTCAVCAPMPPSMRKWAPTACASMTCRWQTARPGGRGPPRLPARAHQEAVAACPGNGICWPITGMRYQEICDVLGIPEGTVKSRMHAAVRRLRSLLGDLVEDL